MRMCYVRNISCRLWCNKDFEGPVQRLTEWPSNPSYLKNDAKTLLHITWIKSDNQMQQLSSMW